MFSVMAFALEIADIGSWPQVMWPIVRINWERSRFVYNLFYKKDKDDGEEPISRQLSVFHLLSDLLSLSVIAASDLTP